MYVWVGIITDRDDVRLTLTLAPRQVKEKEKKSEEVLVYPWQVDTIAIHIAVSV